LLLSLYADDGKLQHVGVAASFSDARRAELVEELAPLIVDSSEHPWGQWQDADAQASSRLPGGQSRWSGTKDLSFVTLAPSLVAEVGYEHMEGTRFRHTAQFKRWRPDRDPESCTYEQLEEVAKYDLDEVLD
jgi:ATP-dependent DNA ligase